MTVNSNWSTYGFFSFLTAHHKSFMWCLESNVVRVERLLLPTYMVLLLAPLVGAAQNSSFDVGGDFWVTGSGRTTLDLNGLEFAGATPPNLDARNASLRIVRETRWEFVGNVTPLGPPAQFHDLPLRGNPMLETDTLTGPIRLETVEQPGTLRMFASEAQQNIHAQVVGPVGITPTMHLANRVAPYFEGRHFAPSSPQAHELRAETNANVGGLAFVHGFVLHAVNASGGDVRVDTGDFRRESVSLGGAVLNRIERVYALIDPVQVRTEGLWLVWVDGILGSGKFQLRMTNVSASSPAPWLNGRDAGIVEVTGNMTFAATQGASEVTVDGSGLTYRIDGKAFAVEHGLTVTEVALGTGALVALFIGLKAAASPVGAALAGYTRAGPLASETRRRFLDLARSEPGISAAELGKRLKVARPSINFHARVLVDHGMLVERRLGWAKTYSTPEHDPRSAAIAAVTKNHIRRRMVEVMASGRRFTTSELSQAVDGCSRPLAAYHLRQLAAAGLVSGSTDGFTLVAEYRNIVALRGLALAESGVPA